MRCATVSMKSYMDALLARRPVPTHSNGFFPLSPRPAALMRNRKRRDSKRPVTPRVPLSER